MNDEEVIEHVNKYCKEKGCMKCAIWDSAAKEHGKRGMCGECFDMHYIPLECNVERLGMPWLTADTKTLDMLQRNQNAGLGSSYFPEKPKANLAVAFGFSHFIEWKNKEELLEMYPT